MKSWTKWFLGLAWRSARRCVHGWRWWSTDGSSVSVARSISRPSSARVTLSSSSCASSRASSSRWRRRRGLWWSSSAPRSRAPSSRTSMTGWFSTVSGERRDWRGRVCSAPWNELVRRTTSRTTQSVRQRSSRSSSASRGCSANRRKTSLSRASERAAAAAVDKASQLAFTMTIF